jgi:hypothetical protein
MTMRTFAKMVEAGRSALHATVLRGRCMQWPSITALVIAAVTLSACDTVDRLLTVNSPSRLAESGYLVPQNAALISNSAVADFECAHGAYIVASGLAAGELVEGTQTAARWSYDRRDVEENQAQYASAGCAAIGVYTPLNVARHTNDQAVRLLEGWTDQQVPNRQRLIARSAAMAGYSLVLLAEGFCSCVIDLGPELTPAQAFDSAAARFTKALTAAQTANDPDLVNLARVGRARALLGKGDSNGAATDAAGVPQGFVFNATHDLNAATRNNRIFAQNNQGFAVTVAPAYRALTVGGVPDPRVRATDGGRNTTDQINRLWIQQKFASLTTPTPIASGIEARLILAEVRGAGEGVGIVNALRARTGVALPALDGAEQANFSTTVMEERNRELWLQGNRWFDMKRRSLPQVPAAGASYSKGGIYGSQRCWPLPDVERLANPNL